MTRAVPRFEYDLLRILRFLLGDLPADAALPLVLTKKPEPMCLDAAAVRIAEGTLAKGLVGFLVRAGGWRDDTALRAGEPVCGRVWERLPLGERALTFGKHPLGFLWWLTAEKPTDTKQQWNPPAEELTAADELFFAVALDAIGNSQDAAVYDAVRGKRVFARNPLAWLFGPAAFAGSEPPPVAPLFAGTRAAIVECLQPWLAARWLRSERAKGFQVDWAGLRQQGEAELRFLSAYLAAAEAANRPDLARFLLRVFRDLYAGGDLEPAFWTGKLTANAPTRLADRLATQRAALAVVQQAETLARWDRKARTVGYFDEGYAAAQWWKDLYESHAGPVAAGRAGRTSEAVEPLRVTTVEGTG